MTAWKWLLGIVALIVILMVIGYDWTPTRDRVLARGPGPVDPDAPEDFTTTSTGLKYRILRKGDGPRPAVRDVVTVNYAGWLNNGVIFDSTYGKRPLVTPLSTTIPGWIEGLQLVREGGMIELQIPTQLGYADRAVGKIPAYANLNYIVELVKVEPLNQPTEAGPADPDAPTEFTTTPSGLKYRILRKGTGPTPEPYQTLVVHYKGWLADGTIFDSSYERGEPLIIPASGGVPGWNEGLSYVNEGGMIELEIPSELGYGAQGMPGIPPNATLHFLVELLSIRE